MKNFEVIVLEEAKYDLDDACEFYDQIEPGVGEYCWDCLIQDIESRSNFAGIHETQYGYYRSLS